MLAPFSRALEQLLNEIKRYKFDFLYVVPVKPDPEQVAWWALS